MSYLDELLMEVFQLGATSSQIKGTYFKPEHTQVKESFKDLMLGVIGEDDYSSAIERNTVYRTIENNLRAELRKKVEEL